MKTLGEPIFLRNLIIHPIRNGQDSKDIEISTIEEVINFNRGKFQELDVPDVNKITFDNRGDLPVLMIDGEEITGSLQNRIIARSIIAEPDTTTRIPVICAEENRWQEIGGFKTGYCSYPRIRSILATSLHKKIDTQREVWQEIDRKLTVTRTRSKTSSMHEIYENLNEEVERYLEGFSSLNHNTVGFIGVAGNAILGCDIFGSPSLYNKFERKLLRSYVLDAIEYQQRRNKQPDVQSFINEIQLSLKEIELNPKSRHQRLKGKNFLGQMLVYKKHPLHISAFPG